MKLKLNFSPALAFTAGLALLTGLSTSCSTCCQKSSAAPNTLSAQEKADGWKLLWDGKTTTGWHMPKSEAFPTKSWSLENGELTVVSSGNAESQAGGDIITQDRYSNFELGWPCSRTK